MKNNNFKILVFGGTFNPPHNSHINKPFIVAKFLNIKKVIFVPSGKPPHKETKISGIQRYNMLSLALKGVKENYDISEFEILGRKKNKYTYQTLKALKNNYKDLNPSFFLLMGADQALTFDTWKKTNKILELATPITMIRPPYTKNDLKNWKYQIVDVPQENISSTELRDLISQKQYDHPKILNNIHPEVLNYIKKYKLYT